MHVSQTHHGHPVCEKGKTQVSKGLPRTTKSPRKKSLIFFILGKPTLVLKQKSRQGDPHQIKNKENKMDNKIMLKDLIEFTERNNKHPATAIQDLKLSAALNTFQRLLENGRYTLDKETIEKEIRIAFGKEDLASTHAARRMLEKHGIDWSSGNPINEIKTKIYSDFKIEILDPENKAESKIFSIYEGNDYIIQKAWNEEQRTENNSTSFKLHYLVNDQPAIYEDVFQIDSEPITSTPLLDHIRNRYDLLSMESMDDSILAFKEQIIPEMYKQYDQEKIKQQHPGTFSISLENPVLCDKNGPIHCTLELPAAQEDIRKTLEYLKVATYDDQGNYLGGYRDGDIEYTDYDIYEDTPFPLGNIESFYDIESLNIVANLVSKMNDMQIDAVRSYYEHFNQLNDIEIMNLCINSDQISYYPYQFDGIENCTMFTSREKLAYTVIYEKDILSTLESNGIEDYFDFESYGRNLERNLNLDLGDKGYLIPLEIDVNQYSLEECKNISEGVTLDNDITDLAKDAQQILEMESIAVSI